MTFTKIKLLYNRPRHISTYENRNTEFIVRGIRDNCFLSYNPSFSCVSLFVKSDQNSKRAPRTDIEHLNFLIIC